jgi:hypothetical protein
MVDQPIPPEQEVRTAQTGSTGFYDLLRIVLIDPQLQPDQKQQLIRELRKNTPASDRWTFRWAIWILGLVVDKLCCSPADRPVTTSGLAEWNCNIRVLSQFLATVLS